MKYNPHLASKLWRDKLEQMNNSKIRAFGINSRVRQAQKLEKKITASSRTTILHFSE